MCNKKQLEKLITVSGTTANTFKFSQAIPKSPNALALSKWYSNEVLTVTEQISSLETELNISCSCSSGCSACCYQLIAVANPETIMLSYAISQMDNDTKSRIKSTINNQCEILTNHGFSPSTLNTYMPLSEQAENQIKEKYFSLNLPCPLLDESNNCYAYHIRPSVCWAYRNYGDPDQCKNSVYVPTAMLFDDWSSKVLQRLFTAKRPGRSGMLILQFALKSAL